MASNAKHRKKTADSGGGAVTRICSINPTGLVFLVSRRLAVCSDVTLAVQAGAPGRAREWEVHGWVVDCRAARGRGALRYRVTLLFHDLPPGLRGILSRVPAGKVEAHPRLRSAPIFGLN